ncbi:MAG: c-type cytochrome [Pseudomonadota bacterium]
MRQLTVIALALPFVANVVPSLGVSAEPAAVAPYTILNGRSIPESLTGRAGDAAEGLRLYLNAARSGCAACHGVPDAPGTRGHPGREGSAPSAPGMPSLERVGTRLSPGTIRLWLVMPDLLGDRGAMPSAYAAGQRTDPADPLHGGPRLTAAEIEDLVAWLSGLTGME